ncbi:C1 domain-containing protein [Calidifontibacter terrae]
MKKAERVYDCAVCHTVSDTLKIGATVPRCRWCGVHVHQKCMSVHAGQNAALHLGALPLSFGRMEREAIAAVDPVAEQDDRFAVFLSLARDEHDAVLDLLCGDWPEAWPTMDFWLIGQRNGEAFSRAFSSYG